LFLREGFGAAFHWSLDWAIMAMNAVSRLIQAMGGDQSSASQYADLLKSNTTFNKADLLFFSVWAGFNGLVQVEEFNIRHARKKVGRKAVDLASFTDITNEIDNRKDWYDFTMPFVCYQTGLFGNYITIFADFRLSTAL
jgi:hypothetical protein